MYDTFDTVVLTFSGIAQMEVGTKPTKHSSQSCTSRFLVVSRWSTDGGH